MSGNTKRKVITFFLLRVLILIAGIIIVLPENTFCQTSLIVLPKRLVFDGKKRTQELNLGNGENDSASYIISVIEMRMRPDGSFEEIKDTVTGQNFASKHLRVFPRYVTLGPNEAQTVKVQLMNVNKMAPGEYRSHIYIKTAPKKLPNDYKKLTKMVTNLSVKLTPVFALTIPVIIRVGPYSATITFSDLSYRMETLPRKTGAAQTIPRIYGKLNRTGAMSAYGNISVEHVTREGLETHVALIRGVAIYAPNESRTFGIDLGGNLGVNYSRGKLRLTFTTQIEDRYVKMADAELSLE